MPVKRKNINLLPSENNANSFSSRLINWVATTGRVVIIITEVVVVGAFLSRFYFDRQNSDLTDSLRQQKAILDSVKDFEKQFTSVQKRLAAIKEIKSQTPHFEDQVTVIAKTVPKDIVLEQVRLGKKKDMITADILASAYQELAIIEFIQRLNLQKDISSIKVSRIEKKQKSTSYALTMSLDFKPKAIPNAKPTGN